MRILLIFAALPLAAQITNISVVGTTNVQAVLMYTAPSSSACTIQVSTDPSLNPLVHDVDPSLFSGSNSDTRSGTLTVSGNTRQFVVGTRTAQQGSDGHWYSRALEALTVHYYKITCGVSVYSDHFTTSNIALGTTYNEVIPPAQNATSSGLYTYAGQYAWPEFLQWDPTTVATDRQETLIDPHTGMSLKRMTMPQDLAFTNSTASLSVVEAPTGVWSNPSNVLVDDTLSATFSASTQDWLVMTDPNINFSSGTFDLGTITFQTKAWCSGGACSGDNAKIQVCLTVNRVSCWPSAANVYDVTLGTTALPSTFTTFGSNSLAAYPWEPAGVTPLVSLDVMKRSGTANVDVSGNMTWLAGGNQFYPGWVAGSKITVGGQLCTIASVTNPQSIAITPSSCAGLSLPAAAAAWSAGNFGIMIRKKTTSTDQINLQYVTYTVAGSSMEWPSGGFTKLCSYQQTQNSVTGHMGYHCLVGNAPSVYWVDISTGDANYLGTLNTGSQGGPDGWANGGCPSSSVTWVGNGPTSPETYYCIATAGTTLPIILSCTMTTTNQTGSLTNSCTNLTPISTGHDPFSLVTSFTTGQSVVFDSTQFNGLGLIAIQNGRIILNSTRSFQDTIAWIFIFDPLLVGTAPGCVGGGNPGCIVAAQNTWHNYPCRWCTYHTAGYAGETDTALIGGKYVGDAPGLPGGGWQTVTVTSGTMTSTPGVAAGTSGCPVGSAGCDIVTVDGEPCNVSPQGAIGGHPADPLNCPKNAAWSYLQDAAVGDVFETNIGGAEPPAGSGLEYVKLISKTAGTGTQWMFQRSLGWPTAGSGPINMATPIHLAPRCLIQYGNYVHDISDQEWSWPYLLDPHGLNTGSVIQTIYNYDHGFQNALGIGGGNPSWDSVALPYGYAISDMPGYGPPNKYGQIAPLFDGSGGLSQFVEVTQDHLSHSQDLASINDQHWFLDARPVTGPGPTISDVATPVSGQLYKVTTTTSDGDNLTAVGGATASQTLITRKLQQPMAYCGTQPLIDVSSAATGNVIGTTSASQYQYCVARKPNECRTGSAQGDIYANCPFSNPRYNFSETYGCNLIFNEVGLGLDLCFTNPGGYTNGIIQVGYQNIFDLNGQLGRNLTHGLIRYRLNNVNQNVRTTPDGKWLLFPAYFFGGSEFQILSGKMLPYPAIDTLSRWTFLPVTLNLTAPGSLGITNAIVQFGYAENGPYNSFFCTSRQEACIAKDATVQTVPFQFATSDSFSGASCASTCTIAIPALSQRVLYYQVLYRNSGNSTVASTGVLAVVTP